MIEKTQCRSDGLWVRVSELPWSTVAAAVHLGYADYVIAVSIGAEELRDRAFAETVDGDLSYVIFEGEAPVAIALIARRKRTCRLAMLGIAPARRRAGLGRMILNRLISEAAQRADLSIELEVIKSNTAAIGLYERMGFRTVGGLVGFELTKESVSCDVVLKTEDPENLVRAIAADPCYALPWQLALESVKRLPPTWSVVSLGDGARAVVNLMRDDAVLLRLMHTPSGARRRGAARALVPAIIHQAAGRPIRVSPLIPAIFEPFAHRLGFATTALGQFHMVREL